jgi:hypothetical protein
MVYASLFGKLLEIGSRFDGCTQPFSRQRAEAVETFRAVGAAA